MRKTAIFILSIIIMTLPVIAFGQEFTGASMEFSAPATGAEQGSLSASGLSLEGQVALAFATPDYPVSPGDVYRLVYYRSLSPISQMLVVESDLTINLGILGSISARGLTFTGAKRQIEAKVLAAYSGSAPSLYIQSLGSYHILLTGEVKQAGFQRVNGLTRLRSVFESKKTSRASIRSIEITDSRGTVRSYDLYKAIRDGDMSQDPYLRPGDTVRFTRLERSVTLGGQVYRGGAYQLLEGESLGDLVESYGDGLTRNAHPEIRIRRYGEGPAVDPETIYIDYTSTGAGSTALEDGDAVSVPDKLQYRPVVYFEGALRSEGTGGPSDPPDQAKRYNRVKYSFAAGQKLSEAVMANSSSFLLDSDLKNAYILRKGESEPIYVDIEELLIRRDVEDPLLKDEDRILIPFRQLFVTVSGGVKNPGVYNYVQGREFDYYLALAGGLDKNEHFWGTRPRITDSSGKRVDRNAEIGLEYRIHFANNNPFRVLTPTAALVSTIFTSILLFR